jgi:4-hydroxy-tetrahydrodipicolinate reductase
MVIGTTGFTKGQKDKLEKLIVSKVPAVISPNFAIGINFMLRILQIFKELPKDYDINIMETHHSLKKDAPSGTAKELANVIAEIKGYKKWIHGRRGISPRSSEDLEILSSRIGGIPGIHKVSVAGPYEMLNVEHIAFSRNVFAQGALYAAQWLMKQNNPGIYTLNNLFTLE